jgi:WD40 repeat protein
VRLWEASTRKPIGQPLTGHSGEVYSVVFSQDGRTIASASDDETVRLWEASTGKPIRQPLTGHTRFLAVAFSPDGRTIASGGYDGTVRLWEASTGKPIGQALTGHSGAVYSVAFSADGKMIASAGEDGTVRLWPGRIAAWVQFACRQAGRNLTLPEWSEYMGGRSYTRTCPDLTPGNGAPHNAPEASYHD